MARGATPSTLNPVSIAARSGWERRAHGAKCCGVDDYSRIAILIRFLEANQQEQPDLATLADIAGLSQSHLHRLFRRWASITPKDFLQCLTVAHARRLLAKNHSVLDTALEVGLSGPGRLHDLCVHLEAASPGEIKSGGAGWMIRAGFAATHFGRALLADTPRGVCHLAFASPSADSAAWDELVQAWPAAVVRRDDRHAAGLAGKIFHADPQSAPALAAYVKGTEFQVKVWRALLQTPAGALTSYGRIAASIQNPGASRAVGTAVGSNPIAYIIPCHRVIRETGVIGEYRWGTGRKRALIAWETAPRS